MENKHKTETLASYYERINRALAYLNQHWREPLCLDKLAELACFSPYHFHRIFQELMGMRVQEYVKRARLTAAAHQLSYSDCGIAVIAQEVGYQSQSAFGSAFQKLYGLSPGQYRKQHQPSERAESLAALQEGTMHAPEMKLFKERHLLYVHRSGDMAQIVEQSWQCLLAALGQKAMLDEAQEFISIAYDNPEQALGQARYDACACFAEAHPGWGELMAKTLEGGLHAVFRYEGEHKHIYGAWLYALKWLREQGFELPLRPGFFIHLDRDFTSLLCQPLEATPCKV